MVINSLADVEKFISIASLSWGGRHFLAIPCEDGVITDEWYDVIHRYNPDQIRTFCELSTDTHERLWKSRFLVEKIYPQTELKIRDVSSEEGDGVKHVRAFFGQPIINLMLVDDFYDTSKGKPHLTYIPSGSNFDLYYKARFGVIDEDEWLRWQGLYISPHHQKNHPDELIENAHITNEQDVLSYIHQHRNTERNNEYPSLIDYTLTRLGQVYIDRISLENQPKSETTHVVIVSKEENVEDFCWFWAIRGQRYHPYDTFSKGPLWINLEMVISNPNLLRDLFINRKNIHIISKTITSDALPTFDDNWDFQTENLQEFYNEHYYIGDTVDVPVNFADNETEYKFDGAESLQNLNSSRHQYAMLDIQIPEIILPRAGDFCFDDLYIANYWITKSGLTRLILSNQNEVVKLRIPTPWDVIASFADAAGYRLENSDKGSIGSELVRLIGGEKNIWIISHPAVLDLLLHMSNVNKINEVRKLIRENVQDNEVKN